MSEGRKRRSADTPPVGTRALRVALSLAGLAGAVLIAVAAAAEDVFAIQNLATTGRIVQADIVDLDGDGLGDLICITVDGLPPEDDRQILAFFQNGHGVLSRSPDWRAPLPRGVGAYDLGELDGRPGVEFLMLRRDRVTVLSLSSRRGEFRDLHLPIGLTLAATQDERGVDRLRMLRDGFGPVPRLLIPGIGETAVLSPSGEALGVLDVGARANYFMPQRPGPVISESELEIYLDHPRLSVGDVDGDGRGDVVSANRHEMAVFLQREDGSFATEPDRHEALHRIALKDHIRSSGSVRIEPADFDADGRLDLLVSTSTGSLFDASTEVGIHMNRNGRWDLAKPDQLFRTEGGLTTNQVIDVDGDGRVELISLRIPTGVLEVVELLVTRSIDAEVAIHRQGTTLPFEEVPWHSRKLAVAWSFETFRSRGFVPTLEADLNGDGMRDLIGSGEGDELDVRLGDRADGYAKRHASQQLDTGGRIRFGQVDLDGLTDFVLYDPRRLGAPIRVGVNRGVLPGTVRHPVLTGAMGGE